jgi:hypothetical protein
MFVRQRQRRFVSVSSVRWRREKGGQAMSTADARDGGDALNGIAQLLVIHGLVAHGLRQLA